MIDAISLRAWALARKADMPRERELAAKQRRESLSRLVKDIRLRLKKRQTAFADSLGVTQSDVSKYESGKCNVSRSVLLLLRALATPEERESIDRFITQSLAGTGRGKLRKSEVKF